MSSDDDPNGGIFNEQKELHGETAENDKIIVTMTDGLNSNIGANDETIWP